MMQNLPNPVYLFQGIVLRRGAKGTGMKSIELALSMCDIVDIYGFTVDPGYTEWLVNNLPNYAFDDPLIQIFNRFACNILVEVLNTNEYGC